MSLLGNVGLWSQESTQVHCFSLFSVLPTQNVVQSQKWVVMCQRKEKWSPEKVWETSEREKPSHKVELYMTKVCIVKVTIFLVVMYVCESWTIKKAECQRIDVLERWCGRRLRRVPWTAKRSNQSILKEISSEYSLKGLMLKLKLQYFGPLLRKTDSLKKTLMMGKAEGRRRSGWQWMRWLDSITDSMNMSLCKL